MHESQNKGGQLPSGTLSAIVAGLMIAASLAAFGRSASYGFLDFDDSYLITNNLTIRGPTPSNIATAFTTYDPELYIPLTLVSYQLNYAVSGLNPGMYHLTNLLLHGLNAFLVAAIIFLILGETAVAILCGLIFAVHPLNTEAVAWVSGRKDLLSSFFLLSSTALYVRSMQTKEKRQMLLSLILFGCAALSKSSVLILPLILFLLPLLTGEQERLSYRLRRLLPFFIISLVTGIIAAYGKTRVIGSMTMWETALLSMKSTAFYVQKILVPYGFSAIYPQVTAVSIHASDILMGAGIISALVAAGVLLWKKTTWPLLCFTMFWISIAPSFLNAHKGTQTFFAVDRYAYVGMIWFLLFGAAVLSAYKDVIGRRNMFIGGLGIVAILLTASVRQTAVWQSDEVVLSHALSLYPQSVSARTGLSAAYRNAGKQQMELQVLEDGLKYSDDTALLLGIGSVKARQRDISGAENLYLQAMKNDPQNPEPHFFLASLRETQGRTDEAKTSYLRAIELDESYVAAYNNLGSIAMDAGLYEEAETYFKKALEWNRNFFEGQYNLFQTLEFEKKRDEAYQHLELAYALNPSIPDVGLAYGYRLHERGNDRKAVTVLRQVLSVDPSNRTAGRLLDQIESASR